MSCRKRAPTLGLAAVLSTLAVSCGEEFAPDDEAPVAPCHPAELQDDFEGATVNQLWLLNQGAGSVGVANGRGFAEVTAGASQNGAWLSTHRPYDMRGCHIWIEFPVVAPADMDGGALFAATLDDDNLAVVEMNGDEIAVALLSGGAFQAGVTRPYDPSQHRWWRFRDEAGTLFFETSPDGTQWQIMAQGGTPAWLETVYVVVGLQVGDPYHAPARIEFDNLNVLP